MKASAGPSPNGDAAGNGKAAFDLPHQEWVRAVVARYERPLVSYAAHLAGDVERARDVVQETFVRLCDASRQQVEPRLPQWLFTVSRNLALDARRKERRMRLASQNEPNRLLPSELPAPDPADAAARGDSVSAVLKCLADLTPPQQEAIRLKFQHGLSYRQIAEVLDVTETNVGFLIHTGLKTVRQRLGTGEPSRPVR